MLAGRYGGRGVDEYRPRRVVAITDTLLLRSPHNITGACGRPTWRCCVSLVPGWVLSEVQPTIHNSQYVRLHVRYPISCNSSLARNATHTLLLDYLNREHRWDDRSRSWVDSAEPYDGLRGNASSRVTIQSVVSAMKVKCIDSQTQYIYLVIY